MIMKSLIKRFLLQFPGGEKILDSFRHRRNAFQPASRGPFEYLNRVVGGKAIDKDYENAFNKIFVLLKSFVLEGDIFEFGVYRGYTSRLLVKFIKKFSLDTAKLHLFDSFEGFPEEKSLDKYSYEFLNGTWTKGGMNVPNGFDKYLQKKLSIKLGREISVVKGFYEETLEKYLSNLSNPKAQLIYLDCDLYSSSKFVLDCLFKYQIIQDGTMIVFDDWMTSLGNPQLGQRRAAQEVFDKHSSWSLEQYSNFGLGAVICVVHNLAIHPHLRT